MYVHSSLIPRPSRPSVCRLNAGARTPRYEVVSEPDPSREEEGSGHSRAYELILTVPRTEF